MKKILNKKLLISFGLLSVFIMLIAVNVVFASKWDLPTDIDLPDTEVETILKDVLNWAVGIVALICAIVIVIAGILWITAGGDDTQLGKARKMLISGIVGLLIALSAYALVYVVTSLFGA